MQEAPAPTGESVGESVQEAPAPAGESVGEEGNKPEHDSAGEEVP